MFVFTSYREQLLKDNYFIYNYFNDFIDRIVNTNIFDSEFKHKTVPGLGDGFSAFIGLSDKNNIYNG